MNFTLLNQLIQDKYIQIQKHPNAELYIYNYAQKVQFEKIWNEVTLQCRGLILDKKMNIIARPFPKFFNLEELSVEEIPNSDFDVFEKMDGSLGILYWLDDKPYIATRGSFTSLQAIKATEMLHTFYSHSFEKLEKDKTYLFEIIYPENRIVVNYGDTEALVLLAIIDTKTGEEFELKDIGFPIVKHYSGIKDFKELKGKDEENREGFVVKFKKNLRLKIKFQEYLRLHRIVTQISNKDIWEYLKNGLPLDEILERVPDEFYQWVKLTKHNLEAEYNRIETQCQSDFKVLETRKETAFYFLKCSYPSILFLMLDHRDYSKEIWKLIQPVFSKPFSNSEE